MANDGRSNLIPANQRSKEEARELGRKGGKASGRVRKDKRTFRETFAMLLAMPDLDKQGNQLISPITGKPMSIRENIIMQALLNARKGNIKALSIILEVMGERSLKVESDVRVRTDKYDHMTDDELQAEARRLIKSIDNP